MRRFSCGVWKRVHIQLIELLCKRVEQNMLWKQLFVLFPPNSQAKNATISVFSEEKSATACFIQKSLLRLSEEGRRADLDIPPGKLSRIESKGSDDRLRMCMLSLEKGFDLLLFCWKRGLEVCSFWKRGFCVCFSLGKGLEQRQALVEMRSEAA